MKFGGIISEIFGEYTEKVYLSTRYKKTITMIADKIEYIIMLIKLFAKRFGLSYMQAFQYISLHEGIEYAEKHYNILHTLSFDDQVDGLAAFCHKKGGALI